MVNYVIPYMPATPQSHKQVKPFRLCTVPRMCRSHSGPGFTSLRTSRSLLSLAMACQRPTARGHLQNAWYVSSGSDAHTGHKSDTSKLRRFLLTHVGRESVMSHHANTRTLGGVGHLHNKAQTARRPSDALLAATEDGRRSSSSAR